MWEWEMGVGAGTGDDMVKSVLFNVETVDGIG